MWILKPLHTNYMMICSIKTHQLNHCQVLKTRRKSKRKMKGNSLLHKLALGLTLMVALFAGAVKAGKCKNNLKAELVSVDDSTFQVT